MNISSLVFEFLARAGGGGSGSSGGDGGGIVGLIVLVGYVPSYYLGKLIKKLFPRKTELLISGPTASLASLILAIGGLSGGAIGNIVVYLIICGIWLGWGAAFFNAWDRLAKRVKKTAPVLQQAASLDPTWDKGALEARVREVFDAYQRDWSGFNLAAITTYSTPRYAQHAGLLLQALRELHRRNEMQDHRITGLEFIEAVDSQDNTKDSFTVAIKARANDRLYDTISGETLYKDSSEFIEFWKFARQDTTWLLDKIEQATASALHYNAMIDNFATQNNLYYSQDMGWLLLPRHGVLFKGGKFGKSDINNHVIGMLGSRLIQLYTYSINGGRASSGGISFASSDSYDLLVAQIHLPKSYEGILVRRKTNLFTATWTPPRPPRDYKKYSLGWEEFHRHYTVHATNQDRLATFELLNPAFMAFLYDTDPGVSIEVADNVVYLYKPVSKTASNASPEYVTLAQILNKAYKELKL